MASIVATPLPALGVVKVIVDYSPEFFEDLVTVQRVTPDGVRHDVIGSPVRLSGGKAILYDSTAPFDVPLTYRASLPNPYALRDDFITRAASNGWGTPDQGVGPYVVRNGSAADFDTINTPPSYGRIVNSTTNVHRVISMPTLYVNTTIEASVRAPQVPTGATIWHGMYSRYINSSNFFLFAIAWLTTGRAEARIYVRLTVPSNPILMASADIGPYAFNQEFRMVGRTSGTSLQMAAWSGNRPGGYTISGNYSAHTGGGYPGFGTIVNTGFSGTLPVPLAFEQVSVRVLETYNITSSSITLVAGRDGWLRDPQDPSRSVRLDNCASHTLDCLDAQRFVFFQGLDDARFESATGVFDVIDAENPLTVAQTRKSEEGALRVVSTTLADIPPLKRLFSPGRDLLVSLPEDYGWGLESYNTVPVTVGDVTMGRLNRRDMRKPQRLWTLPVRVVDADETFPSGATGSNNVPVPGATFGDMKATGLTNGQLKAGGKTYLDWAQGVFT